MLGASGVAVRAAKSPKAAPALISCWEFDESSSAEGVFEDRGPAHALMIHVGTWADLTTGSLVEGDDGTSAYTDGSAYATIPANVPAHELAALTISFYYQRASASDKHILLAAGNGSEVGDLSIEVLANGRLRGWHTGQDGALRFFESTGGVSGTNLQVGTAHRIDLSLGSQGARIYLDGAELTAAAIHENTNGWNNTRVKYLGRWTDGVQAAAVGLFDRLRLWSWQLTSAEIADLEPPQPPTLPLPSSGFTCMTSGAGPLVDLGNQDNNEAVTNLSTGGNARYDASGIIKRIRWLGTQGCSSPNRSATTEQFLFRFTADHNGGCISGGAVYSNIDEDHNYDQGGQWAQLYPCSDGGQLYIRRQGGSLQNFSFEGFRMHGVWDPFRVSATGAEVLNNITIRGCWATCVRDDFVENDTARNMVIEDNLIGDIIGQNVGCWVLFSCTGGSTPNNIVEINDNLVWNSAVFAPTRPRAFNGYACGSMFKVDRQKTPRLHLHDNVFMADIPNISQNAGDPLGLIKAGPSAPAPLTESSGNLLIWRDLSGVGSYVSNFGPLPPGFTVIGGSEGTSEWNQRVAAWKAAHPNVRRFNKPGIARAGGGTINLVDQG